MTIENMKSPVPCPVCGHAMSSHDPEDGTCDALSRVDFGVCQCGRTPPATVPAWVCGKCGATYHDPPHVCTPPASGEVEEILHDIVHRGVRLDGTPKHHTAEAARILLGDTGLRRLLEACRAWQMDGHWTDGVRRCDELAAAYNAMKEATP